LKAQPIAFLGVGEERMRFPMTYDAIVVGGSYAGLSAALQLARARRNVLVIDEGKRRNRFADVSHCLLGRDGRHAGDIATEGRAQLLAYPTVHWLDGRVEEARRLDPGFEIVTGDGSAYQAARLVLAMGVTDDLPEIPGLKERWGKSVFNCPYCHGFELEQQPVGVIATSVESMRQALLMPDWAPTTLFVNGEFRPDEAQLAHLEERGVTVERIAIAALTGENVTVELIDGRILPLQGLFLLPDTRVTSPIAEQLGCEFVDGGHCVYIKTGDAKGTTVHGVFACGDAARPGGSVPLAIGDGALAGITVHQSLIFKDD
jgi:thioredoxin reductase